MKCRWNPWWHKPVHLLTVGGWVVGGERVMSGGKGTGHFTICKNYTTWPKKPKRGRGWEGVWGKGMKKKETVFTDYVACSMCHCAGDPCWLPICICRQVLRWVFSAICPETIQYFCTKRHENWLEKQPKTKKKAREELEHWKNTDKKI